MVSSCRVSRRQQLLFAGGHTAGGHTASQSCSISVAHTCIVSRLSFGPEIIAVLLLYVFLFSSFADLQAFTRQKKHKTFILKPESGCQGKGIWMTKNPMKEIKPHEHMLCQQYISRVCLGSYNIVISLRVCIFKTFLHVDGIEFQPRACIYE